MNKLREKTNESIQSILPISAIVVLLSITIAPMGNGILTLFLFGTLFLIFGMGLFTMGTEMSMQPLGEGIGIQMSKAKRLLPVLICCFVLGIVVTIAEPDLQVLAEQIPSVPNQILIWSVALGGRSVPADRRAAYCFGVKAVQAAADFLSIDSGAGSICSRRFCPGGL